MSATMYTVQPVSKDKKSIILIYSNSFMSEKMYTVQPVSKVKKLAILIF